MEAAFSHVKVNRPSPRENDLLISSTSIALAMFLVNIEVSVVATSLVAIVDDLQSFNRIGWVVTSYLVTYTSMCQYEVHTGYGS